MENTIKVVIMIPSALTERWQKLFCMDALSSIFDLEYWDCSRISNPSFNASVFLQRDYTREIIDFNDMEKQLRRLPKDVVIFSHIHLEGYNYNLHKLISSYNKNRVYVDFWANSVSSFINITQQEAQDKNNRKSRCQLSNRLYRLLEKVPPLLYAVKYIEYGGGNDFRAFIDEKRKLRRYYRAVPLYNRYLITVKPRMQYSINHPDYEQYLNIIKNPEKPLIEGRYVVFLDQCFPSHPSLKTENPDVDFEALAEPYYRSINGFFEKVEKRYDCKVVIAGHPIANYGINPFGGRPVFFFKTAELVYNSIAVILHCSFSISFPLLFNKPICFIANKALLRATEIRNNVRRFGIAFDKTVIDTDLVGDISNVFSLIDNTIREKYIDTFFDINISEDNKTLLKNHIISIHHKIEAQLSSES